MPPTWLLLASLCALSYALEGVWIKKLSDFTPEFLSWCTAIFTVPFFLAALWYSGLPAVKPQFYAAFAVCLATNAAGLICFFRAFSYGEVSLVFPLLALTPAWMLFTTKAVTGEFPIGLGLLGVVLSTIGCYALGLDGEGFLSPFKNLWRDPGSRWALLTGVIWSVTSNFDKAAIKASSATFHSATGGLALALVLYVLFARRCREDFRRLATFSGAWRILVLAVLVAVLVLSQYLAIDRAQTTYVVCIKKGGLAVGVLLGWLLLKERYGARRFAYSLVVLSGLLLIILA